MRILQVCDSDYAGVGIKLTQAINRTTKHKARHIRMVSHRFGYPHDIQTRDPEEVKKWVEWADVVNTHVTFRPLRQRGTPMLRPRCLLMTHHGSHYRGHHQKINEHAKRHGVKRQLCTQPNLLAFGDLTWVPIAIPVDEYRKYRRRPKRKRPLIVQTPSNPKRKRTKELTEMLGGRKDVEFLVVEKNTPNHEVLSIVGQADLVIDQFARGYGVSGLEAMAMGIPVISHAEPWARKLIFQEVGYLPYYETALEDVPKVVTALLDSRVYKQWSEISTEYIRAFHDYPVVAKRYIEVCREALRS